MPCGKQIFSRISPEQYQCLLIKTAAAGFPLAGNSGQVSHGGYVISWNYDLNSHVLEIECVSSPFFVPCSMINGKIRDLVDECVS
jgi:hypothetical protein